MLLFPLIKNSSEQRCVAPTSQAAVVDPKDVVLRQYPKTTSSLMCLLQVWFSVCRGLNSTVGIQQEFTREEKFGCKILNPFLKELIYGISVL